MSTNTASSTSAVNKTKYGDIPLLTSLNFNSWQKTVLLILQEIDADKIIPGEENEAQPLDVNYKDYKKQTTKAANIISLSYSPDVKYYIDHLTSLKEMWDTLKPISTPQLRILVKWLLWQFRCTRPKGTDEPGLDGEEFHTHFYTTVPNQFEMTVEVRMGRNPEPSIQEIIAAIQQKATTAAIAKDISDPNGNLSTAMNANTSVSHRGGLRGCG